MHKRTYYIVNGITLYRMIAAPLLLFFLDGPVYLLFYITAAVTAIELVEEIILVLMLPQWKTDVKGLYWVIRWRQSERS